MTVFFLHIPKAAGTTLNQILIRNYDQKSIFTIGVNTQDYADWFKLMPEEEKSKLGLVKGHMTFGLHKYLTQSCTYITMLRNPVDRIISSYYYVLRTPIHYLHEEVTSKKMSLQDFISSGIFTDLDNGQTRRLAGVSVGALIGKENIAFGSCSIELLEEAKRNILNHFSVVAIQERFDESLLLMKDILEWDNCFYISKNIGKYRSKLEVDKTTLELIKKFNILDIELYEFSTKLLEDQISAQSKEFELRLARFSTLNSTFEKLATASSLIRSGGSHARSVAKSALQPTKK